jgi:hypothetical protein
MITYGTQIINERTNTIHVVDGIETINDKTLVFTQDIKCFPLSEVKIYSNLEKKSTEKVNGEDDESLILSIMKSCNNFPIIDDNLQKIMDDNLQQIINDGKYLNLQQITDDVFSPHFSYNNNKRRKKNVFQKIFDKIFPND